MTDFCATHGISRVCCDLCATAAARMKHEEIDHENKMLRAEVERLQREPMHPAHLYRDHNTKLLAEVERLRRELSTGHHRLNERKRPNPDQPIWDRIEDLFVAWEWDCFRAETAEAELRSEFENPTYHICDRASERTKQALLVSGRGILPADDCPRCHWEKRASAALPPAVEESR